MILNRMCRLPPLLFFCLSTSLAWGEKSQSHTAILDTVRHYLETQVVQTGSDYRIDISPIDAHLQLALCDGFLEAFSLGETRHTGLLTVGVRCTGSNPWTLYTRAKVGIYQMVLVLRESLPQGAVINAAHLDFAQQDIIDLRNGYFTTPDQAVGKRVKRTLAAGTVLTSNVLETPKIIKRGQKVSIRLRNGMLDVQMEGTALTDAEPGQRIQVRNENSKRVIQGTAVAPGVVEVD